MVSVEIVEPAIERHETILHLVNEHGVRQIGRGYFGTVFAAPKSKSVFKVCRDSAYLAFIVAILKYQDNPWFPRVYSASLYYPKGEPWYMVTEIERLRKGKERELKAVVTLLDASLEDILQIGAALHVPKARMQHLAEMQRLLFRLFKKFGPDFHHGNIMFRRAHPVIIDPIVSGQQEPQSQ